MFRISGKLIKHPSQLAQVAKVEEAPVVEETKEETKKPASSKGKK